MRKAFCDAMVALAEEQPFVFLTGDLGFMALEPLQRVLGARFINAGVAEQNMVSVAAGMAWAGAKPWVYSIAPFCYARPFEQIRNDVCLNALGVRLVGNGGGYGYGAMGATHHALEDYGVMSTLPGMRSYLPAFDADVGPMVHALAARAAPSYLRLGRSEIEDETGLPPYDAWRCLQDGAAGVIVVAGPIAGALWSETRERAVARRPALWVMSEIGGDIAPMTVPAALRDAISSAPVLGLVEEHVAQGGLGQQLLHALALGGQRLPRVIHAHARGYPSGRYGSQSWHRRECGLDAASILRQFSKEACA